MNPNNIEYEIRKYLSENITEEDKGRSIHLFGVDFINDPINEIIGHINSLYEDVQQLSTMIDGNFKSSDDVKVLMPSSRDVQQGIVQDCAAKNIVLTKVLEAPYVTELLTTYRQSVASSNSETRN